jgi:hypothetical protein
LKQAYEGIVEKVEKAEIDDADDNKYAENIGNEVGQWRSWRQALLSAPVSRRWRSDDEREIQNSCGSTAFFCSDPFYRTQRLEIVGCHQSVDNVMM